MARDSWSRKRLSLTKCDIQQTLLDRFGLSKLEACAIHRYTKSGYLDYYVMANPQITPGRSVNESKANFKALISALNKMPTYRGHVFFGQSFAKEYIDSELKAGRKFLNLNFTSYSTNRLYAVAYSGVSLPTSKKSPPLKVLFELEESCQGRDIKELSKFGAESEVLFLPQNPWEIVSKGPAIGENPLCDVHVKLRETLPCKIVGPAEMLQNKEKCHVRRFLKEFFQPFFQNQLFL